jgi:hypothetical protein
MAGTKERKHMDKTCKSVILLDDQIQFVSIVDENAKLLVGQVRPIQDSTDKTKAIGIIEGSANAKRPTADNLTNSHFKDKNMYTFYSEYLLWIIRSCLAHLDDPMEKNCSCVLQMPKRYETSISFEISGIDSDRVKLIVTPLNTRTRTFLCVYFEPSCWIKGSSGEEDYRFKTLLRKISIVTFVNSKC